LIPLCVAVITRKRKVVHEAASGGAPSSKEQRVDGATIGEKSTTSTTSSTTTDSKVSDSKNDKKDNSIAKSNATQSSMFANYGSDDDSDN
jgi:hypothetical protein